MTIERQRSPGLFLLLVNFTYALPNALSGNIYIDGFERWKIEDIILFLSDLPIVKKSNLTEFV